ncbi:3H domain-containing protein [Methanobacterium sp. ACI-7]|uniref:3H domain-containing protein n=1 Tax=unclassified Methanobacterium TaxID=2627676 RepID=UPI0039C08B55
MPQSPIPTILDLSRNIPPIPSRVLFYAFTFLTILIVYGIIGSTFIMGLSPIDSIYYTIITIATVGYGDIAPITPIQKLFSITLVLGGVGLVAYAFTLTITVVTMIVEEVTSGSKIRRIIAGSKNHFVLCGYGRVGRAVFKELKKRNQNAIIIERDTTLVENELWKDTNVLAIPGNATDESTLIAAGIERARGVIIATGDDVDNLFITLTVRELNPEIWIVARASKGENIRRLYRAGADKVVSPETSGGADIYFAAIEPTMMKITEIHDVDNIKKESEIILKYGCTLEDIEYHLPEFKAPLARKIELSKREELDRFLDSLNRDESRKRALERIYESVSGIHSHWISGPDKESLDKVTEELKKEGFLLGVNLNEKEIREVARKYGRLVEVVIKPEMKITESHVVGDIRAESEIILKHGCTLEDIEYYLPGFREPLHRKIGLSKIEDMDKFLQNLEYDNAKMESLERLYALSGGGIHSHTVSGPDIKSLSKVEKELNEMGYLLGVNLSQEEIYTKIKEYGRVAELLLKHEVSKLDDKRIVIKYGGRILDSKHYLPGVRQVVTRTLYVNSEDDVINCEEELKKPDARRSMEALYEISRHIHSHTVAAPDVNTIKKIEDALDKEGILLGINLPEEEIWRIVESQDF